MMKPVKSAFSLLIALTILLGFVYPAFVWGVGQLFFPFKANGSLLKIDEQIIGSALIGQNATSDKYFWPRPSASSNQPYQFIGASGSQLSPANPLLIESTIARTRLMSLTNKNASAVPVDFVTSSGSGLDPHISPEAAAFQLERVAKARGMDPAKLRDLIAAYTQKRTFGLLGEPRVNVLRLNLALDRRKVLRTNEQ